MKGADADNNASAPLLRYKTILLKEKVWYYSKKQLRGRLWFL